METGILSRKTLPLFVVFFTWSIGSAAMQLGRPLFAYRVSGESVFLVTVMVALTGLARVVGGPLSGFLADRWGRKPLVILGAGLRSGATFGEFFVDSYVPFVALEFVGQAGVSIFITGSSVLMADVSEVANRGRIMAMRSMSSRLGAILGPAAGGALALIDLRYIFLFNATSKALVVVITAFLIAETMRREPRETSPLSPSPRAERGRPKAGGGVSAVFMNPTFVALAATTIGHSMMMQGLMHGLFPVHAQKVAGIPEVEIGGLLSLIAVLTLVVAMPNGWISDRFGRKASLVPGMTLLGLSALALGLADTPALILLMVFIYGAGEGMVMGSSQAYAMDLAPPDRRGAFLGVWAIFREGGGVVTPLVIGALYEWAGPLTAFGTVAAWLLMSALLMAAVAKETAGRKHGRTLA